MRYYIKLVSLCGLAAGKVNFKEILFRVFLQVLKFSSNF